MAFVLTFLAGFSTLLGLMIINIKINNNYKIIVGSLSFAAGVMICISIIDLIPESLNLLSEGFDSFKVILFCFISIVFGVIIAVIFDKIIQDNNMDKSLYKIGIISMITIIIHNIPEGIITFISTTANTSLGIKLAIAIAMHNIPEGISIGVPIYYGLNDKKKAYKYTLISALSEPLGGLLAFIFIGNHISNLSLGILFGIIAGIMISISINELLAKAINYKLHKITILSFIFGVVLMLINILIFN